MSLYDFTVTAGDGSDQPLSDYAGKVVLIVNTASKCGFTPQFDGLEDLYKRYAAEGLVVLGFPCNQFANQDPGTTEESVEFCRVNYGVTFPMMGKIDVNGSNAEPLFKWLTSQERGFLGTKAIKWNFTKFLVGRDGKVIGRYSPKDEPSAMAKDIEQALQREPASA